MTRSIASGSLDVLVATSSVGAGHDQAARAIATRLRIDLPEAEAQTLQVLDLTPGVFRRFYFGAFVLGMTRLPKAYGLSFALTNRPHASARGVCERFRLAVERKALARLAGHLLRHRPRVVLCTHFLPAPLVAGLIGDGRLDSRLMVCVTDINVHRFWYCRGVDRWFAPAPPSAAQLRRWDIPDEKIIVSGIPVHPKWTRPLDAADVRKDWRLPAGAPIVLLTGGTQFTCGPVVRIARRILEATEDVCLVVLAGRNKKLLGVLSGLEESGSRLFGMGYTDRLHELAAVSSLMVTKPGGVMTAECLAKGLPMILTDPVPGQEGGNAAYFQAEGAAVIARGADQIAGETARLIQDAAARSAMAANARRLYRPATETITDHIRRALGP